MKRSGAPDRAPVSAEADSALPAAYGGIGWVPRQTTTADEMGSIWGAYGNNSEWAPLQAVLLHAPGDEMNGLADPDQVQMLAPIDPGRLREQHAALADAYRTSGVSVHGLDPEGAVPPNTLFMADLVFMTPEGAVLARPASSVRAGEERHMARRLTELGIPILRSVHGSATFEGADAMWLDERTVLLATGLRTNAAGAGQVSALLEAMGLECIRIELPRGAMHLMGSLRLLDEKLAMIWPGKSPPGLRAALAERGLRVLELPDEAEGRRMGMNMVVLAPRKVVMPEDCPRTRSLLESAGVECIPTPIDEIAKAAGGMGCLTAVLKRKNQERSTDPL